MSLTVAQEIVDNPDPEVQAEIKKMREERGIITEDNEIFQ